MAKMSTTKEAIDAALERGHTIDITTKGRRTGRPRRLEIVFHNIGGRIYISGTPYPGKRKWLLNLEADPHFTFHLKGRTSADLPATARVIEDEAERRDATTLNSVGSGFGSAMGAGDSSRRITPASSCSSTGRK